MTEPLLRVTDLKKYYSLKTGKLFGGRTIVKAVDGISFEVGAGQTLGRIARANGTTVERIMKAKPQFKPVLVLRHTLIKHAQYCEASLMKRRQGQTKRNCERAEATACQGTYSAISS